MLTSKMQSLVENTYRLLEKADHEETPAPMGALILAVRDLAEAVEGLIENDSANQHCTER